MVASELSMLAVVGTHLVIRPVHVHAAPAVSAFRFRRFPSPHQSTTVQLSRPDDVSGVVLIPSLIQAVITYAARLVMSWTSPVEC